MQPVTITRPFSAMASPIAESDSALARIEEAAGVDDHHVGAVVAAGQLVALGAQVREDPLGIDQRLGAAQRDERDLRGGPGDGVPGGGRGGWRSWCAFEDGSDAALACGRWIGRTEREDEEFGIAPL